ncbi:MAG: hypothetical protein V4474_02455 [Patescibacteria group bacterium]
MAEPHYLWYLLGIKPFGDTLKCFAFGGSRDHPELVTEYEPIGLAFLKNRLPKDQEHSTEGYILHACRITVHSTDPNQERGRCRGEFLRFLERAGMTRLEQEGTIKAFVERLTFILREGADERAGIRPLAESLWGKSGKIKFRK